MSTEVHLNASALSPNALYVSLDVSALLSAYLKAGSELSATLLPSIVSRIASGFNSRLRTLIDSGSSHCFISAKVCELNAFTLYAIQPVNLRYLDSSTSVIDKQVRLLTRFPSGDVHLVEFYVTRLDSPCDLVLGYS